MVVPPRFFYDFCDEERQKKYQDGQSCLASCEVIVSARTSRSQHSLARLSLELVRPGWNSSIARLVGVAFANICG